MLRQAALALALATLPFLASSQVNMKSSGASGRFDKRSPYQLDNSRDLLGELEGFLAEMDLAGGLKTRAAKLEEELRPVFQALPLDSEGRLGHTGVLYLLHRAFAATHGWSIRGFRHSSGEAALPAEGSAEAEQASNQGFSLAEIAVLAAKLEMLVSEEVMGRLSRTYELLELSDKKEDVGEDTSDRVLDVYTTIYAMRLNHTRAPLKLISRIWNVIERMNPDWDFANECAWKVRNEVVGNATANMSFSTQVRVMEQFGKRFSSFVQERCLDMKKSLLKAEAGVPGWVSLTNFYKLLRSNDDFGQSSISQLRESSALDESDPHNSKVIIPNYLGIDDNCIAGSNFYSVCCENECASILGSLEQSIAAPNGLPSRIAELVEQLPSATREAPRPLPAYLVSGLDDIAAQHGGSVPLHGRFFEQWLHLAYPRECADPQLSGAEKLPYQEEAERQRRASAIAYSAIAYPGAAEASEVAEVPQGDAPPRTWAEESTPQPQPQPVPGAGQKGEDAWLRQAAQPVPNSRSPRTSSLASVLRSLAMLAAALWLGRMMLDLGRQGLKAYFSLSTDCAGLGKAKCQKDMV